MLEQDLRAWLALHSLSELSDRALARLAVAAGNSGPAAIFSFDQLHLNHLEISPDAQRALQRPIDDALIDPSCEQLFQQQISLLPLGSEDYPALLADIVDPPPLLYVRGDASLLHKPQLAMVGSRHTSRSGRDNAFRFSHALAAAGFSICSGLALGIDTESHRGALAANGTTVAVLGTGIDVVYPARNRDLFEDIAYNGVAISEFALGTGPRRHLFPLRNRVISGLSVGVLVVEAALKSGSLITARTAMEQGREVWAIPGSIHSTGSHGCHQLIKQGAKLVETVMDIMEELQGWLPPGSIKMPTEQVGSDKLKALPPRQQQLLALLGHDPATIDWLQQRSGWSLPEISSLMTTLELNGWIENRGGYYQRVT
jgi:DNA processing protein